MEIPAELNIAVLLFAATTLVLLLIVVTVLLLVLARRRRRQSLRPGTRAADAPPTDAWEEAGRRAEPFPDRRGER
ncbi:MAG: hypothetical protein ACYTGC_10065 [Planctomycetota bacterium]